MKKNSHSIATDLDYRKTMEIAKFYDSQSDAEVTAEIEAAIADEETVMVQVPRELLPDILKLIGKRRKSA